MKRNIFILILSLIVVVICPIKLIGQNTTLKPKIMVIPFTKEGEDIRTVLEDDVNKRIALTKIKEAFDNRGYSTVDFFGKLKSTSLTNGLSMNQQQDFKTLIIQQSGAEVYVEAEIDILNSPTGNAVKVILNSYETSTGNSLSNTVGESGKFYTDDYGKLTSKAVELGIVNFLNVMQEKFYDIVENGRSITINIGVDNNSAWLLSNEIGSNGLTITDALELWMEENAYKNAYHIQGSTDRQMIFDEVKIPLKDANGNNYNISKFGLKLMSFFRDNGIKIDRSVSNNTLVITIK
ncbi:MAG: hypothetical protein IJ759_05780 [Bacteroidales bacterium]|nr:hypothetical protein [Bacteroidales bacterium]